MKIKDLPITERPRERLLEQGASSLSNAELIAILIRAGSLEKSAIAIGQELISQYQNLRSLARASIEDLCKTKGIGKTKAVQIYAAFELARRLTAFSESDPPSISSPEQVVKYLIDDMALLEREELRVVILNTKNQILAIPTVTTGTLNSNISHPREIFRKAIQKNASSIIMVHNHPSGDPTPSNEDISLTKRYFEAGKIIGIELWDHIIIGNRRFVSLREEGYLV